MPHLRFIAPEKSCPQLRLLQKGFMALLKASNTHRRTHALKVCNDSAPSKA